MSLGVAVDNFVDIEIKLKIDVKIKTFATEVTGGHRVNLF
jgi:hypothetical protein